MNSKSPAGEDKELNNNNNNIIYLILKDKSIFIWEKKKNNIKIDFIKSKKKKEV